MEPRIKLHRLGIGELLGEGWLIYASHFKDIVMVVLCVYLPTRIVLAFIQAALSTQPGGANALRIHGLISSLLQSLIGIIATIAIASITDKAVAGRRLTWRDALKHALSIWDRAIGTGVVALLILLGLGLLFVIPGIIFSVYYAFWIYAVVLRRKVAKAALDYSKSLVEGQWWRVFGTLSALAVIGALAGLLVYYPLSLISGSWVLRVGADVVVYIVGMWLTVTLVLFFLNNDYVYRPRQQKLRALERAELQEAKRSRRQA